MKAAIDIYISEEDLIDNIQRDFGFYYPYLRLQFFKLPHVEKEGSSRQELLMPQTPICEATMFHKAGRIDISPNRRVSELENDFYFKLGLNVQVFRKTASVWLETTTTDELTLKAQNEKGKNACMD